MPNRTEVYLEQGTRRVFAGALKWPGWCRSARDEDSALEALVAYGPRYSKAVGRTKVGFEPPSDVSDLKVVERLKGDGGTDFGVPGKVPAHDDRRLTPRDLDRLTSLLRAGWATFDRAARAARGKELTKGPRGGGRELDAIVDHVMGADGAYLHTLGGFVPKEGGMASVRRAIVELISAAARGEPPPRTPRSGKLWSPRYGVRRSAWHALDHAWEIEDRAKG